MDYWDSQPTQGVVQKTPYSYNSWNETQYQKSLQVEPGKEIEGAKAFHLDVSVLGNGVQCPPQSIYKHQCSLFSILKHQESHTPGISNTRTKIWFTARKSAEHGPRPRISKSDTNTILQLQSPKDATYNQVVEESGRPATSAAAEVCYGMVSPEFIQISHPLTPIQLVDVKPCSTVSLLSTLDRPRGLVWDGKMALHDPEIDSYCVQLQERTSHMLNTLLDHAMVTFQFLAQGKTGVEKQTSIEFRKRVAPGQNQRILSLSIILYGPADMAEAVGSWLGECHMYLQMPKNCDRNVPYSNPHCLSFSDEDKNMTFELVSSRLGIDSAELYNSPDVLAELDYDESLEEAPQPSFIATSLYKYVHRIFPWTLLKSICRYQKQGLTFMLNREKGWDLSGSRTDV